MSILARLETQSKFLLKLEAFIVLDPMIFRDKLHSFELI